MVGGAGMCVAVVLRRHVGHRDVGRCGTSRAKMRLRSRVKMRCPLMKSGRYLQPCNIPGGSNVAISTEFIVQVFDFVFLGIGRLLVLAALSVTPPRAQKI